MPPPLLIPLLKLGIAAGSAIGGWIHNRRQRKKAQEDQKELMALQLQNQQQLNVQQYENQRKLNEQGQQIQMDTFRATGPAAQIGMLKDAGLNPALMYGKGGMGGTTVGSQGGGSASAGSAAGGSAPGPNYMDIVAASQIAADIKLKEAQARNLDVQSTKTEGIDTDIANATLKQTTTQTDLLRSTITTEGIKQDTMKLDQQAKAIDISLKGLDLKLGEATFNDKVKSISEEAKNIALTNKNLINQIEISGAEANKKAELLDQQIKLNNWQMAEAAIRIAAAKSGIEVNNAKMAQMKSEILQGWEQLAISERGQDVSERNTKAMAASAENVAYINGGFKLGAQGLEILENLMPGKMIGTIVKGFGGK